MKLGEKTREELKDFIKVCLLCYTDHIIAHVLFKALKGDVSLLLDMWTSSNGFTFLGIVMHYVTNYWEVG